MEDAGLKNKVCCKCGNFKSYYFKGLSRFSRTKNGYCRKHRNTVENMGHCEFWRNNDRISYEKKVASPNVLSKLLKDISDIRQILLKAQEEDRDLK